MGVLSFGFAAPWILAALLILPALYYLLRLTPPQPKRIWFPPLKLLVSKKQEETPQSSPLWLIILRLALAACLICAFAQPLWRAEPVVTLNNGPLALIIDNSWAAAPDWTERSAQARDLIERAATRGMPVMMAATSSGAAQPFRFADGNTALTQLSGLAPEPFLSKRMALIKPLQDALARQQNVQLVWLSDGVDSGDAAEFLQQLKTIQPQLVVLTNTAHDLRTITGINNDRDALVVQLMRLDTAQGATGNVRALDRQNRLMASAPFSFANDAKTTTARFELPSSLRNDVFRLEIAGANHAAAVQLLDERWQRKTVGLYSGNPQDTEQPLLSSMFILGEAMNGFADVVKETGSLTESLQRFINGKVGVIILADVGAIPNDMQQALSKWIDDGGVLVRFAGLRLVEIKSDPFLPVSLRPNLRSLGGELSWEKEQKLGRFSGPLADLMLPDDVTVSKQALAEAEPDLNKKTWAELADGVPLITAEPRGRGHTVLVHVSAEPSWSNLPLSGTFLEILRRMLLMSNTSTPQGAENSDVLNPVSSILKPLRSLDGFGTLISPPASAQGLSAADFAKAKPDAEHPPGLYGIETSFHALNTFRSDDKLEAIDFKSQNIQPSLLAKRLDTNLQPGFLVAAFLLFLADCILSFLLMGSGMKMKTMTGAALVLFAVFSPLPAQAQKNDAAIMAAANSTRLAFIRSGIADVDDVALAGLKGLTQSLRERTAIEPDEPVGIDLMKDELVFYPMLYWPIDTRMEKPSKQALEKAEAYMKNGGTIVFDTRDRGEAGLGGPDSATPGEMYLRDMLNEMNTPRLEALPGDHVLTKSFYILTNFPGRFEDGPLWVEKTLPNTGDEKRPVRLADGVSSLIVTSNDLAGAWATDDSGQALLPLYGSDPRQREMAMRAGINIVVYLLTGNYKSDQVHIPDLLQRLGQ
ncbi:MAG: DUF4159 domain-containing protein [Pseudomonadota bacterium]